MPKKQMDAFMPHSKGPAILHVKYIVIIWTPVTLLVDQLQRWAFTFQQTLFKVTVAAVGLFNFGFFLCLMYFMSSG